MGGLNFLTCTHVSRRVASTRHEFDCVWEI